MASIEVVQHSSLLENSKKYKPLGSREGEGEGVT